MNLGSRLDRSPERRKAISIRPRTSSSEAPSRRVTTLSDGDREAARRAWRHFARASGGRDLGQPRAGSAGIWLVGLGIAAAGLLWFSSEDEPAPTGPATRAEAGVSRLSTADDGRERVEREPPKRWRASADPRRPVVDEPKDAPRPGASRLAEPSAEVLAMKDGPAFEDDDDASSREPQELDPPPRPRHGPRIPLDPREAPQGTNPDNAEALAEIPVGRSDGPPLGGVGAGGIHIDQLAMGTSFSNGECSGPADAFSLGKDQDPTLCLRVVHLRQPQRVVVHWYRGNRLKRRSFLTVPGAHAYRTRATLSLREEYVGRWRVEVLSTDGVRLAEATFEVVD